MEEEAEEGKGKRGREMGEGGGTRRSSSFYPTAHREVASKSLH